MQRERLISIHADDCVILQHLQMKGCLMLTDFINVNPALFSLYYYLTVCFLVLRRDSFGMVINCNDIGEASIQIH